MSDCILIDGDLAIFETRFGAATITVRPGWLAASGPARATGKTACVIGDEGSVSVSGCAYFTAIYSTPGTGTLTVDALAGDQQAQTCAIGGKRLMLRGSTFKARFSVTLPAMQPPPGPGSPTPDPMLRYEGRGTFTAANAFVKAS